MDFWRDVETAANTTEANAVETEIKLTEGTIVQVWLFHPEGCHGLAHAQIWEGGHQRYPHTEGQSYHGNDVPMIWDDNYEIKKPAILKLKTWNLDDTYAHTVYLRITILRAKIDVIQKAILDVLDQIRRALIGVRTR